MNEKFEHTTNLPGELTQEQWSYKLASWFTNNQMLQIQISSIRDYFLHYI
jgi:hypothetical protein